MKIVFYISTIRSGGAARVMVNLANMSSRCKWQVVFITNFRARHEYNLDSTIHRISLEETESKAGVVKKNMRRCRAIRKIIKDEKPDIMLSFMGENNFRALLACAGLQVKNIVSVRNDPNREYSSFLSKILAKTLYKFAEGCIFQTDTAMEWFPKCIQKKSRVILNQVDEKFYNISRNENPKGIVTLGRLSIQKNHKALILAYSKVAEHMEDDLYIYGEGELLSELRCFTEKLKLCNRVHFMSYTEKPEEIYSDAKIFVLSSDYEGMPNTLMEAMACGVPCVSTDCPCGGARKLIIDGENGFLVPVNSVDALAKMILELTQREKLRKKFSQNAKITATKFAPDIIWKEWKEFFEYIVTPKV